LKKIIISIIIISIIGITVYIIYRTNNQHNIPTIKTIHPEIGTITTTITAIGIVESSKQSTIYAKSSGIITKVLINEGNYVKKGQQVVLFDTRELENKLAQAKSKLLQVDIELNETERQLNRTKELYQQKVCAKIQLDNDTARYENTLAQKRLFEEEVMLAQTQLSYLNLISPQDGIIIMKDISSGQAVNAGQMLFKIVDPNNLQVKAEIDEVDGFCLKVNQEVIIKHESLPNEKFKGFLYKISPQAKIKANTIIVETIIRFNHKPSLFKIGNQVDIEIITSRKNNVLYIPLEVIYEEENKKFVFVYDKGLAVKKEVKTGLANVENIEIISGITVKDEVIIPQEIELKSGDKVKK